MDAGCPCGSVSGAIFRCVVLGQGDYSQHIATLASDKCFTGRKLGVVLPQDAWDTNLQSHRLSSLQNFPFGKGASEVKRVGSSHPSRHLSPSAL